MDYRMSEEFPGAEHALQTTLFSQSTPLELTDSCQNPSKYLPEDVLPEASAFGDPSDNVSFHLNIAAHSSLFMEAYQRDDEDQYLDCGIVNPREVLQPPFCSRDNFNNLDQLANLSLQDVESVLQCDQGSSDFQTPYRDTSASFKDELVQRYGFSSTHTASHEPVGLPSTYPMGYDLYTSPPLASTSNSNQHQELPETYNYSTPDSGVNGPFPNHPNYSYDNYSTPASGVNGPFPNHSNYSYDNYSTPASGVNGPFPNHPNYSSDQLLPETTDHLNKGGMGVQPSSHLQFETLLANNYLDHLPQPEPSQPYQSSPEADSPSNSAYGNSNSSEFVHSRKGYKHRHQRIYGLSEEDQKRRNQELNNEASQLYRQRKATTMKALETQHRQEEERKEKLSKNHRKLCKQIEIYKRALDNIENAVPIRGQSIY